MTSYNILSTWSRAKTPFQCLKLFKNVYMFFWNENLSKINQNHFSKYHIARGLLNPTFLDSQPNPNPL